MDETSVRSKMQQSIDVLTADMKSIRTGRATPALVEAIVVPVYGATQFLKIVELASITTPDTQTILISPWDKSIIGEIKQGIMAANVGMNPVIDNDVLRISFPPLTTEDREKYVKLMAGKLENAKVAMRQIRADFMHDFKKKFEMKEITEDQKFGSEKKLQEITDEFVEKIERMGESKKHELLQI
jgi:ribosome recycling factor